MVVQRLLQIGRPQVLQQLRAFASAVKAQCQGTYGGRAPSNTARTTSRLVSILDLQSG